MSTLGATSVHRLSLAVPWSGSWRADIILEGGETPAAGSKVTLTVGGLAFAGQVERAALDAPDRPHVVVVGGLGWERPLERPLSYQQDAGVRLSTVLRDLAELAGETLELPARDLSIGTSYACPKPRPGETVRLRDALAALQRAGYLEAWRADPDGKTRFGARSAAASSSARATTLRRDAAVGVALLGVDELAGVMPGSPAAALDGKTVRRLVVTETAEKLEAEVWGAGAQGDAAPAASDAIARMIVERFPQLVFGYPRTYVVTATRADGRLDLAPPADAPELPTLPAVDQWTLGGAQATPSVGDLVVVGFRDANPTRPFILDYGPLRLSKPTKLQLDASSEVDVGASAAKVVLAAGSDTVTPGTETGRVVRYGDPAQVSGGVITLPPIVPAAVSKVRA